MKKIISLIVCVLLSAALLVGCGLVDHNYERDYKQVVATIASHQKDVMGKKTVFNAAGMPVLDEDGEVTKVDIDNNDKKYTAPKVDLYKSQLVNYANYYLKNDLQNYGSSKSAIESRVNFYIDSLIKNELLVIEADSLFNAGILYWTLEDIEEIQRSVYTDISDAIFANKNIILERDGQNALPEKGGDPATGETTYPIKPDEGKSEDKISPKLNQQKTDEHQWFDAWYTNPELWYIGGAGYKNSFPGLYEPSIKDKSLAIAAFAMYIDNQIDTAENIIGVTKEQKAQIDLEIEEIKRIRASEGISYVYPYIGSTLLFKLTVGVGHIKSAKLAKLEAYHTDELTEADYTDVTEHYDALLKKQKSKFAIQANYDKAIDDGDTILYYPTDRYVFTKHILLPFSDEQTAALDKIKSQQGNEDVVTEMRAQLARQIKVYEHVDGENYGAPKTLANVTAEITAEMNRLKNSPKLAERAFTDFIYKYNTDPGIFDNEKGYAVVYELGEGESEKYMVEFAEAARAFRSQSRYSIGDIYYDNEILDERGNPVPYIITDYGVHIMYYCMDPVAGEVVGLDSYVTKGEYSKVYDLMKDAKLEAMKADVYSTWESRYIRETQTKQVNTKSDLLDAYVKEIVKQVS